MNTTPSNWQNIAEFLEFWLHDNPLTGDDRGVFETYYASYVRRFSPYMKHHFIEQTKEATQLIRAGARRVLEVGAGCGTESLWFSLLGADVTAIDLATDRLAVAKSRRDWLQKNVTQAVHAQFVEISLFDFEAQEPFDLIWMEQTFHHLEPRAMVYTKLASLLRPGGSLVICEVNAWNLLLQLQFFMQRGFKTKTSFVNAEGRSIEYGNERVTTPSALRRGLEGAGFGVESIRPFRLLPNSDPPLKWLGIEQALVSALPAISTHYIVVAVCN